MRQGPNGRRPRGRPNRKQHGGPPRPNTFDSNGPDGRIRGNAHQVFEKYIALARDALSSGDRVSAETYYQHAEHYFRIVNGSTDPEPDQRQVQQRRNGGNGQARGEQWTPQEQPAVAQPAVADGQGGAPIAAPEGQPGAPARRRSRSGRQAAARGDDQPARQPDVRQDQPDVAAAPEAPTPPAAVDGAADDQVGEKPAGTEPAGT